MPRPTPAPRRTTTATRAVSHEDQGGTVRFSSRNWILLGAGLLAILAGYVTLSGGSTVAAPLLLVAGYAVLVPLGIFR